MGLRAQPAVVKTEWVLEADERTGKTKPRKIGLQPVMRDGIEYAFDVILLVHIAAHGAFHWHWVLRVPGDAQGLGVRGLAI